MLIIFVEEISWNDKIMRFWILCHCHSTNIFSKSYEIKFVKSQHKSQHNDSCCEFLLKKSREMTIPWDFGSYATVISQIFFQNLTKTKIATQIPTNLRIFVEKISWNGNIMRFWISSRCRFTNIFSKSYVVKFVKSQNAK